MDKNEVREIVKDEVRKFLADGFDKETAKVLHASNSKSRDELINTIKNSMEAIVKVLWQKKEFWKSDVK